MTRIAILHDTFMYKWGAERLVLLAAKALQADIYTAWKSDTTFDPKDFWVSSFVPLGTTPKNKWVRQIMLRILTNTAAKKYLSTYDTVVFSGDCLDAILALPKEKKTVYYCHTPPRYLFDRAQDYEQKTPRLLRPFFRRTKNLLAQLWLRSLDRVDILLTNSRNTQKRIEHFSGKKAHIVYPPVDTDFFSPGSSPQKESYFLSFGRLASIKRVDMIVRAFAHMPEKKLVLVYGENDPQKEEIISLAQAHTNIILHPNTNLSDEGLRDLIRGATANIYIPKDEDFGMNPVEALACGIPTIGVAEGGLLESIEHEKTGILLPAQLSEQHIIDAVRGFDWFQLSSEACRISAERFSYIRFKDQLHKLIFA